ncbi:MAG TPA: hypothetical protein VMW15_01305 [Terracidiphilus sp.]|nr:hypothetical protein [Terracidiphilus sp.]
MRPVRLAMLVFATVALTQAAQGQPRSAANSSVVVDFSNPALSPSHWTLTLHRDGSGHFHSEHGDQSQGGLQQMEAPDVDRSIHVSPEFAQRVFLIAQRHKWFNDKCESHLKVAFQGWKKLSYVGPEGQGACTFNYSQDKDIQALGDEIVAVAETVGEGARLEMLLQHDRLGLDREIEFACQAVQDGRMRQIGVIKPILERLAGDDEVLDRVRKQARILLAHADE